MTAKKIFLDSSAIYAFIDRADPNHPLIGKILDQMSLQGTFLFTSIQNVQDVSSAVSSQLGMSLGFDFLQTILDSSIEVVCPQKNDLVAAFRLIKFNRNRQITLKEALTAVMMQKRNINQILTFNYWQNLLGTYSYLTS